MLKSALGCLFTAALLLSVTARAQVMGIDFTKLPQPKEYKISREAFESVTREVRDEKPYNDPTLGYSIRLGKDWTDNQQKLLQDGTGGGQPITDTVLGILARYISQPINLLRSSVVVEAQNMTYEISVKHWFINFVLQNGFSLNSLKEVSPRELVAMYVQVINDQTYVVRARLLLNGSKLILIRYYLPQENYEEYKAEQAGVVDSFKLLSPVNARIEKQREFGFIDQSYFNYPVSWSLKSKSILSIERMSALLYQQRIEDRKSILEGQIKVSVISRLLGTSMADEVKKFKDEFKIENYSIGPLIETLQYHYDKTILSGTAQVYKLAPSNVQTMRPYELGVVLLQGNDYYYILSMITPGRDRDFYTWAQNMETLRIVSESMRRYQLPSDYNPNDPAYSYKKEGAEPPPPEITNSRTLPPSQISPMVIPGNLPPTKPPED